MQLTKEIQEKLSSPFEDTEVKFKPAVVRGDKALALAYVDARTVLDRLDETVGPDGWHDEYQVISSNQVVCKLTILGITKSDAGEAASEDKEPLKSALSDALKRAAVKFGVGRYLYRLHPVWCSYDASKNTFLENPLSKTPMDKTSELLEKVKGKSEVPDQKCSSCGEKITGRVAVFSKKYYKRPLCIQCQNEALADKEKQATIANVG